MQYRYRTFGARGTLKLLDDAVWSETVTHSSRWSHETPYRSLDPNPVKLKHLSPMAAWVILPFMLIGMLGFMYLFGAVAAKVMQNEKQWSGQGLAYAAIATAVGSAAFPIAKRIYMVDWVTMPTSMSGHRIQFTQHGPDEEQHDDFLAELLRRIELHHNSPPT